MLGAEKFSHQLRFARHFDTKGTAKQTAPWRPLPQLFRKEQYISCCFAPDRYTGPLQLLALQASHQIN